MMKSIYPIHCIIATIASAMALAMTGCGDDDKGLSAAEKPDWAEAAENFVTKAPAWTSTIIASDQEPDWAVDLKGSDPAPSWVAPSIANLYSSMEATVALPSILAPAASKNDVLAAFIDDECRGIATYLDGEFAISILGRESETSEIKFKYYSASLQATFDLNSGLKFSSAYPTVIDLSIEMPSGDAPAWTAHNASAYPVSMTAVLAVPDALSAAQSSADLMGAFVGDECRGIGGSQTINGAIRWYLMIKGSEAESESVTFKYYCAVLNTTFIASAAVDFEQDLIYGTTNAPKVPALIKADTRPTYTAPDYSGIPLYMSAYVTPGSYLAAYASAADQMGAFVGDECRGIGSRNSDGSYSINVLGFEDEEALITFRYYSAELATVFSSRNSVEFSTEYSYGGAGYAATPDFTMSGKYPVLMTAVVSVDNSTIQPSGDDQVAAFVGDECRGVGSLYAVDGSTYIFQLYVYGLSEDETVTLYYYSAKTGTLYADNKHIRNLANNEEWGTYLVPIELTLEPVNAISFYLCLPEELKTYASASDQMAAFVGENCCGVGEFGADGIWRLSANAATADQIELRYYNSDLGYLFTDTKAYAYAVDSAIGSEAAPHTLDFGLDSLHPLTMRAYFSLPSWLSAVTSYNDMMAAFVDGECRGVATVRHTSLGYIFVIDIHGSLSGSETVTIRYYSSDLQSVYVSHRQFTFSASATIGTETAPEELILTKK